jgi:hypothetical protein
MELGIASKARQAMQHGARVSRGFIALHSGLICFVSVLVFVSSCVLLQWLRSDLDWRMAPMSSYLKGPYGAWLRLAYYGLGVGLVLLGHGLHRTLRQPLRSPLPMRLLAVAGVALVVTAVTETNLPGLTRSQELVLHQLAALVTFVSVTVAMLLESWRFQDHAAWRPYYRVAFPWAVASFVALAGYACGRGMPASLELPEGLFQKIVITMIMLWLGFAAWRLRCAQLAPVPERDGADEP